MYSDAFTNDLKFSTDEFIGYMMYSATSTTLPISEFEHYTEEEAEQRIKRISIGGQPGSPLVYKFT